MTDEAITVVHVRQCEHCTASPVWLKHISANGGMPLFSICLICGGESKAKILPPRTPVAT